MGRDKERGREAERRRERKRTEVAHESMETGVHA